MSNLVYDVEKSAAKVGIDAPTMMMLVGMLVETLQQDVDAIGAAVASKDISQIYSQGHRLKGSAANLNFMELAEACRYIETSAKQNADIDYEDAVKKISAEANRIIAWHKEATK